MNAPARSSTRPYGSVRSGLPRMLVGALTLALALIGGGCAAHHTPGAAFPTAEAAVDSLVTGLRANDRPQLDKVLGSDADQILSSGDSVADANGVQSFLNSYDAKHQLQPVEEGVMTLEIGPTDWPMPIPLVRSSDGWRFDTAAGLDEMLTRRIGRNELDTIETCRAIADAQQDYFAANPMGVNPPCYADRLFSSPGKRDGLYWPAAENEPQSPVGELLADAWEEGYRRSTTGTPNPYHGYLFGLLNAQGKFAPGGRMSYLTGDRLTRGFAVVAYPAEYGNSGIKTFIINQQGIVFQRDLGDNTADLAKAMTEFDPSPEWDAVELLDVEIMQ
jgi:hypothetical protein